MVWLIVFNVIIAWLVASFDLSLVKSLPGAWSGLHLSLIVTLYILLLFGWRLAFVWFLSIGLLFDVFTFGFFGAHLAALALVMTLAYFLLLNFFTNRSLYAILILTLIVFTIYDLLIFVFFKGSFWPLTVDFWIFWLKRAGINLLFSGIVFYLINFLSRRFKPVFINRLTKL